MMKCKHCGCRLELMRMCRSVKMRCSGCNHTFPIGDVIHLLDEQTLMQLEMYNVIIYD